MTSSVIMFLLSFDRRILNRFSADIGQVDQGMAALMSLVMNLFVEFFGERCL
jgi:hypothetical protein